MDKKRINYKSEYYKLIFKEKPFEQLSYIMQNINNVVKIESNRCSFYDKYEFTLKKELKLIKIDK